MVRTDIGGNPDFSDLPNSFAEMCRRRGICQQFSQSLSKEILNNLCPGTQPDPRQLIRPQEQHDQTVIKAWLLEGDVGPDEFWAFLKKRAVAPLQPQHMIRQDFQELEGAHTLRTLLKMQGAVDRGEDIGIEPF